MADEARTFAVEYLSRGRFEAYCLLCGYTSEQGPSSRVVDVMVRHIRTAHL